MLQCAINFILDPLELHETLQKIKKITHIYFIKVETFWIYFETSLKQVFSQ